MKRKMFASTLVLLVCVTLSLLVGCGGSSTPVIAVSTTAGTPQTQTVGEAFPTALAVNVTSNGTPLSNVVVGFTVPSSGASCAPSATTATTNSSGNASITCTANTTPGAYSVTATAAGATTPASFSLTNQAPSVFVFSVNGLEEINGGPNYYGVDGAVAFDLSGNVLGGAQDYNDGVGLTSPTGGDTIAATGSSLTMSATTGTGILVLATSNTSLGINGVETFTVQFANADHGLITQFDGTATSSGSLDLQTNTAPTGNFAFTLSGTDSGYFPVAYGGVFTDSSGAISGTVDVNDDGVATVAPAAGNMTGTDNGTGTSAYGRGTASVTINGTTTLSLAYYIVGPEVIRIIDTDPGGTAGAGSAAVGSAYGQGTSTSFDSTALGTADVFGFNGNPWGELYAAEGSIVPTGSAGVATGTFTGEGDTDNGVTVVSASPLTGTYTIATNGYGSLSITNTGLGAVTTLGLYTTDPTLNLYDPNNTTSGQGGALVLEMDDALTAGAGIVVPQAATTAASDLNNSYAFGAQDYNSNSTLPSGNPGWEFDLVGQGSFSSLAFAGTGKVGDPFGYFVSGSSAGYTAVPFSGTATGPDAAGRYAIGLSVGVVSGSPNSFAVAMYEANSGFVFWMDEDIGSLWLGSLEMQAATVSPFNRKGTAAPATRATKHWR
jgi:hypothetical protein